MKFCLLKQFIQQGPLTVQVTGGCMRGAIAEGSDVRLQKCRLYWPGDIIAFKRTGDEIVSHRLLGYLPGPGGWFAITRADEAQQFDSPVALRHVLGRVTHVNGQPFRPEPMDRIRAQAAWVPGVLRLIIHRLRRPVTVLEKT